MSARLAADNGHTANDLWLPAAKVYAAARFPGEDVEPASGVAGWKAAAAAVLILYDQSPTDEHSPATELSYLDLAAMVRNNHAHATETGSDLPFDNLPPIERFAWEAVARFLAWAVNADEDDDLVGGVEKWAEWAATTIRQRGISFE